MGRTKLNQDLVFRLRADIAQLKKGLKQGQRKISIFQKGVSNLGKTMIGAFAGVQLIQGIGAAIKKIAALESKIKRVSIITGGAVKEFNNLARALGKETKFTAIEAADAMTFLAQAGFNTNEILKATPGILNLAAAAQLDLAQAADIASNILSGYGMEASRINELNDLLVVTTNRANTNVEQLGEAMKIVAPIAKSAGLAIKDAAAFIGVLGDAGIQGTAAGTQLKGAISALINPTAKGEKVLKKLGVTVSIASDGSLNLTKTLEDLKAAGITTKDAFNLFNKISASGALVMADATEKAKSLSKEIGVSLGAAADQASEQMDTLLGSQQRLSSAWENALQKGSVWSKLLKRINNDFADLINGEGLHTRAVIDANKARRKANKIAKEAIERIDDFNNVSAFMAEANKLTTEQLEAIAAGFKKTNNESSIAVALSEEITKRKTEENAANAAEIKLLQEEESARLKVAAARLKVAAAAEKEAKSIRAKRIAQSIKPVIEDDIEFFNPFATTQSTTGFAFAGLIAEETAAAQVIIDESIGSMQTSFAGLSEVGQLNTGIIGSAFQGMSNVISNALNSTENIFQAFSKFFGNFIKGMIIKLVAATIAALALTAVLSALGLAGGAKAASGLQKAISFGAAFKTNLGNIGGFADGGVTPGGLQMVGERGKEIVAMPQGSRVLSHQDTMKAISGKSGAIVMVADVRLKGEDIWLAFTEADRKLGNTRG